MRDSYTLHKRELKKNYKDVFEKIEVYVLTEIIDNDSKEKLMMNLLNKFKSAQDEEIKAEEILEVSIEDYCKKISSEITKKSKIKFFADFSSYISYVILIFIGLNFLIEFDENNFFEIYYNYSPLILGGIVGIIMLFSSKIILRICTIKYKGFGIKSYYTITSLLTILLISLAFMFMNKIEINFPIVYILTIASFYLVFYHILKRKSYSDIKVPDKIRVSDMVMKEFPNTLEKSFNKKNAKLIASGKNPLTKKEFTKKLYGRNKYNKITMAVTVLFVIGMIIYRFFDLLKDIDIIGVVFFIIFYIFIMYKILYGLFKVPLMQLEALKECIEKDIDIFEYFDTRKNEEDMII